MTVRPEVIEYLRENLSKFPVDVLRSQLYGEGVSDLDFEDCLALALRAPKTLTQKTKAPAKGAKAFLFIGLVLILGAGLLALLSRTPPPEKTDGPESASGESGYVGNRGWVVRLPKDYVGISEFKDKAKSHFLVHFCKRGTDPTNFLNEDLFGQMEIVRLDVTPSPFPPNPTGVANLTTAVNRKIASRGEKFVLRSFSVGTLPGVLVNVQSPYPRVEAYLLGKSELYFFYGGQEDEVWRDIVLSLRDARSEN
ncbi:MAG: hypothetical protein A2506_01660 [Elusimicrobia bacterium RIFOXYD12_FULL_66_9]|nr:MAG: hypothetical protein A2506_01660 [Elusimicrobia bacterium RIFOXYD12_FULL_66_9]